MGKKASPEKIQKIIKEANKAGGTTISMNDFVEYMINKQQLKAVILLYSIKEISFHQSVVARDSILCMYRSNLPSIYNNV